MTWNVQTLPAEISAIDAWRNDDSGYTYLTLTTVGGRITISNDLHGGDPARVRAVLVEMLAAWDAVDPAKGGLTRYDAAWPPKQPADGEGS